MSVDVVQQHEQLCRIRAGQCTQCCEIVPPGGTHPDPCPRPVKCLQCHGEGHVRPHCTAAPMPQPQTYPAAQPQAQYAGGPPVTQGYQQPAPPPRARHQRRGHRRNEPQGAPPANAPPAGVNVMGQRQTYHPQGAVNALHQPHHTTRQPSHYGNRLSNAYWGRAPPAPPNQYQTNRAGEKARRRREQKIDQLEQEVVEIRQIIEEAMGDLAKLKDYVDQELDVRAHLHSYLIK